MKALELLAPAKNTEFGKSAINCGADAVYIGSPKFGARSSASNSVDSIAELIKYAHKFNAKVYVALNTLLYNDELESAQQLIHQLWNIGSDAIIIQDMGILEMNIPPIPLFASTQTHNTHWQKVQFLEKNGIQRVILARELSLLQIQEIREKTQVELEAFIHGAICVCYSGQCYLSHAINGKSGNRGECSQPCRWDYNLIDENGRKIFENKHLLSPKDLNLSSFIEPMIEAGITSFKIEGRLKDMAYLKNITSYYRQEIDRILEGNKDYRKASSGKSYHHFTPEVNRTFNRDFTNYFIDHKQKKIASFDTPKSLGKPIAEVEKCEKDKLIVKAIEKINNGDGLCFFSKEGALKGFRVNRAEGNLLFPAEMPEIQKGTQLYRNHDQEFETFLLKHEPERKIAVDMSVKSWEKGILIQLIDEDQHFIEHKIEFEKQIAQHPEKALENLRKNLSKTGNSIFEIRSLDIELAEVPFMPASLINELRREAFNKLEDLRISDYKITQVQLPEEVFPYFQQELDYTGNIVNIKSREFYEKRRVKIKEPGFELLSDTNGKALMTSRYCIRFETGTCPKLDKTKPASSLYLESGKLRFRLEFDCKACIMRIYKA